MTENNRHLELLCDAGEMFALLSGTSEAITVLDRCVDLVAGHLSAEVCSIYLMEKGPEELVLRATKGLNPEAVGTVRMAVGEGLVGKAMRTMRPVIEDHASRSPDFKHFPTAAEDPFECFMAIPILRGNERIGVLVVQRRQPHRFTREESMVLRSIASQLAMVIENARILLGFENLGESSAPSTEPLPAMIRSRAVSRGVAMGPALVADHNPILQMLHDDRPVDPAMSPEGADLELALSDTAAQIEAMEKEMSERLPEAVTLIFSAHLMILRDKGFSGKIREMAAAGTPPLTAVVETARRYITLFGSSRAAYLREKVTDVEDIALRLIENLRHTTHDDHEPHGNQILVARELLPSEVVKLSMKGVAGIVLAGGGTTSHTSILARSLDIPMVICDDLRLLDLASGTDLVVDADQGNLYVSPDAMVTKRYAERIRAERLPVPPATGVTTTREGIPVCLMATINLLAELEPAVRQKAEGIGLYRSEFPFLVRTTFPTEAEQVRVYQRLLDGIDGREVTIRTLDVGGDKTLSYFHHAGSQNPALGLRSIRFSFHYPDIFEEQIRAILKAAGGRKVRIMFPMIASMDEFRKAKSIVKDCLESVRAEGNESAVMPSVGMMIELPSVVEIIAELTREVDFFSIGTNDFVQYMLAVDRTNERVASYYAPEHPGVLRALKRISDAVNHAGSDLSVCGEMAASPELLPFLIGIGIRRFSVVPALMPEVRKILSRWTTSEATAYAGRLLAESTLAGVRRRLKTGPPAAPTSTGPGR